MSLSPDRRVLRADAASTAAVVRPLVVDTVDRLPHTMDGKPITAELRAAKDAGFRKGWDRGWLEGHERGQEAAYQEFTSILAPTLHAVENLRHELARQDGLTLDGITDSVLDLAYGLVESLLGRELELSAEPVRDALKRAITLAPDRGAIRARLNPDDVNVVSAIADQLVPGRTVEILADHGIERGGCVLEVGACSVDAQIAPALARVREVLKG